MCACDSTDEHGLQRRDDPVEERVKKSVVTAAKDTWEIYFSRLFPASVRTPRKAGGKDIPVEKRKKEMTLLFDVTLKSLPFLLVNSRSCAE